MIGTKDVAMVNTGRKLVKKYKDNFSIFAENEFCVRIGLVNEADGKRKIVELKVNSDNWMDYLENGVDFGDYKVYRMEAFIPTDEKN